MMRRYDIAKDVGLAGLEGSSQAVQVWSDGTGVYIPRGDNAARERWQRAADARQSKLLGLGERYKKAWLKLDQIVPVHEVTKPQRYEMYVAMARAERDLPPIVVRARPDGLFEIVDGHHRFFAAKAVRLPVIGAWVIH